MKEEKLQITNHDFLIYHDNNGDVKVNVMLIKNDLWLTQNLLAELFDTTKRNIGIHLQNIYLENELNENSTRKEIFLLQKEGNREVNRSVNVYNLDAIIAVGYRVNSKKATNFRIWATKVLKEYMIKGVVMDDERLKNPNYIFGEDYFEETLERIRNIRSSERRFYQKITDIYGREILHGAGKISHEVAKELAYKEYDKFKLKQDQLYSSDFNKFLNEINNIDNN